MSIRVCVEYSEYCTHSEHSNEAYGHWEEQHSSSVDGVSVLEENETGRYSSDTFIVPDGTERVHVVYMIYDTGDSFGSATGRIDIVHCTANETAAHKLAETITNSPDEYTIKFIDDFGRDISINNRGAGYFESITYVGVESYDIGQSGRKKKYYVN